MKHTIQLAKEEVEHAIVEYLHRKGFTVLPCELAITQAGTAYANCIRPEPVSDVAFKYRTGKDQNADRS